MQPPCNLATAVFQDYVNVAGVFEGGVETNHVAVTKTGVQLYLFDDLAYNFGVKIISFIVVIPSNYEFPCDYTLKGAEIIRG